jgi:hypothetical protein
MSDKKNRPRADGRRVRVRAIRGNPPDLRKLSRALIALAMAQAQAEADAQAEHQAKKDEEDRPRAA